MSFDVVAHPGTDLWRKPPTTDSDNAPTHSLTSGPVPLSQFQSARVTFHSKWTTRYDQGGLVLKLKSSDSSVKDRWFKAGIEFYLGKPYLASVATYAYSDWALTAPTDSNPTSTTIEVRREGDELGTSLWLYELVLGQDGTVKERVPLREVTWMFAEEQGWSIEVSAMAARPATADKVDGNQKDLVVHFSQAEVDVSRKA